MIEKALRRMGLTGHEAQVYISTVQKQQQTGYEIANDTGIARANVYAALSTLLDKGYVHKVNETPARYVAVTPSELSAKVLHSIEEAGQFLVENLKEQDIEEDSVINLTGEENILEKTIYLLQNAESTIYIDAFAGDLHRLSPELIQACRRGIKVVIISLGKFFLPDMLIYENLTPASWIINEGRPLRLIVDSSLMLTGELGREKLSRGIYSRNTTLVMLAKHSYTQEIILAEVRTVFGAELEAKFGHEFATIRNKVASSKRRDE